MGVPGLKHDRVAAVVVSNLEGVLGHRIMDALVDKINCDYLGSEMEVVQAIESRPELFERAVSSILGKGGDVILSVVCRKVYQELGLDPAACEGRGFAESIKKLRDC
ncbi:hypothetical protein [Nitrososphaera sp.]|uniref:hypothetical protein n=1 Tax=Nitrososphaera sp. TaxID=1971748 RepID=UPI00307E928A